MSRRDHQLTNKAYSSNISVTDIYKSFTHKIAAKTDWRRYGTKLRHRHGVTLCIKRQFCILFEQMWWLSLLVPFSKYGGA